MIAIHVSAAVVIIVLFAANHHSITYEGTQATHVSVVGAANPCECAIVAILIQKDFFPVSVGVTTERVLNSQRLEGPSFCRHCHQPRSARKTSLKEFTTRKSH